MFQKIKRNKIIKIITCLFLILVIARFLSDVNISKKNTNYNIDVNLTLDALQQAKSRETDVYQEFKN
jgi:hypothetical protein